MKKNSIILLVASLVLMLSAFKVISEEKTKPAEQAKSIAWYVANVKEAKAKNQQCFDNPGLKATEDCENALHALQISFKGGN
ncbi:MAG: EexN family lipoprotein [Methylomonas sp.]|jgi:hypothetical protein|uniref:EexN family lipoprotein n=1 Tax=Methylomonas sp. TaxID=418 RepID=UPI0025D07F89|nr:EexN family lipoprotein [Methylomonas sp.]MCK9605478.1 EexN family lipoprotein [Methylomonas sp.]